jgi:hypothetical protein
MMLRAKVWNKRDTVGVDPSKVLELLLKELGYEIIAIQDSDEFYEIKLRNIHGD